MKKEAASAGVLDTSFGKFACLQILTIEDLFRGQEIGNAAGRPRRIHHAKRVQAAYAAFGHGPPSPSFETSNPTYSLSG